MQFTKLLNCCLLAAVVTLVGCSSSPKEEGGAVTDSATATTDSAAGASSQGAEDADAGLRQTNVFYFDYDQASLREESYEALKAHSRYLVAHPEAAVRLEGHCDERGTREYNVALGERRGNAIIKFLRANGVTSNQVEVVSYGEEKPVALGHDESSWAQNRRVEIKY